ncbi:MAG TPA: aminotransferase class I/II-fold pyridoxal phosphate-dependent enzyme, partial [Candidatus Eisenbacteria bacterium]|nr:aminotransferase class I/II-fold pyridoxal phosphate-dependent enzyme [Candidatus Eisenbacteria bacterium]
VTDGRLRLYPNPTAQPLREKLAKLHRCKPENIIIGNGSDELLAMAVRAFVEPAAPAQRSLRSNLTPRDEVQFFHPGYSLYPVLAATHGAKIKKISLAPDFGLPLLKNLNHGKQWNFRAPLSFITTPNAPSGRGYTTRQLEELCAAQRGVVVLDEAYTDFASENALSIALTCPHVLVARTFSKAYSLCFLRIGYFVGSKELIGALDKIRDSYNVNGLGQIAALETLNDLPYYRANFRRVITTRRNLSEKLAEMGFKVFPSQTNFILVRPPRLPAAAWLKKLRAQKILVRWFNDPALRDFLRISIGTPEDSEALVRAAKNILRRA